MSSTGFANDYRTITPYLVVQDVPQLLDFLQAAFGAQERVRVPRADGSVMHAEVLIGDSIVKMGEPKADMSPTPGAIFLRVDDSDSVYRRALESGATSIMEPTDQPHAGERYGGVKDPCGNLWWPASPLKS
jgi:PhnB protein